MVMLTPIAICADDIDGTLAGAIASRSGMKTRAIRIYFSLSMARMLIGTVIDVSVPTSPEITLRRTKSVLRLF